MDLSTRSTLVLPSGYLSSPSPKMFSSTRLSPSPSPPSSPTPKPFETTYRSIDLSIGVIVAILNVIEVILILRIRRKKTIYERLLLSLSIADTLFGISDAAVCIAHLVRTRNSTTDSQDVFSITYTLFFYFVLTSTLHILIINLDRLWAISWPIKHKIYATFRKLHILIGVVWVVATALGILLFVLNRTSSSTTKRETLSFKTKQAIAGVVFAADLLYLIIYGLIIYKIKHMRKFPGNGFNNEDKNRVAENKLVTVCTTITILHMILTAPFAYQALQNGGRVDMWFNAMLVANSGVNSIVYFFRGKLTAAQCCVRPPHSADVLPPVTASSSAYSSPLQAHKPMKFVPLSTR